MFHPRRKSVILPRVSANHTETTFRYERWRAVSGGILETAGTTFLLLIAVRHFSAGATAKGLLSIGGSVGLMLGPLVVGWVERARWPAAKAASLAASVGAVSFLVMALLPWLPIYVAGGMIAMAAASATIPLMTQVYQDNYPEVARGRLFSRALMIRIGAAVIFAYAAGFLLSRDFVFYMRWLLVLFAAAFGFASWCFTKLPSRPLTESGSAHPLRAFHAVRADRLFRWTLICWMLMGFANLMMYPLRVEYLANPAYEAMHHQTLDAAEVALLVSVIPNMARFALSPLWGWLFDRMNFFVMRIVLNIGFALGILSFFTGNDLTGLVIGAVIFGVANAGGDVAWGLWVTKFAPPERVADYMAVHTFFTGLRGVIAPILGFQLVQPGSLAPMAWVSGGLILAATLMLVPEIKSGGRGRKASPLVEEVSE